MAVVVVVVDAVDKPVASRFLFVLDTVPAAALDIAVAVVVVETFSQAVVAVATEAFVVYA